MLENWYIECINEGILEHHAGVEGDTFLIFKGFRIYRRTLEEKVSFEILDTRKKDFYTPVDPQEMAIFQERGFLEGAKHLEYYRNRKRIDYFSKEIDREFMRRKGHEKRYDENPKRHQKAIDVHNSRIIDLGEELKKYTDKVRYYERVLRTNDFQ